MLLEDLSADLRASIFKAAHEALDQARDDEYTDAVEYDDLEVGAEYIVVNLVVHVGVRIPQPAA